jgi:hypothetical protein
MSSVLNNCINNAKSDGSERILNTDVCIRVVHNFYDKSIDLHLNYDSNLQQIITLNEEQTIFLIGELLKEKES